jgi:Spy/CpxP family protein refolding chaperone
MPKSRLSAAIYLSLVFLSGALVGGLSYRLYAVSSVSAITGAARPSPEEARKRYIDSIRAKVNLDEHQIEQVNQILDQTRAQFDQIRGRMHAEGQAIQNRQVEEITSILREDQKPLYAAFRAERERIRQQQRERERRR